MAVNGSDSQLMLEHFKRIQTTLTGLVELHNNEGLNNPQAFIDIIVEYEQVHIVTRDENYAAMRAKGDYDKAGITLRPWGDLSDETHQDLWRRMLRGKVANADEFKS